MALDSVVEDFVYAFRGRPGIHAVRHPNGSYSPVHEDVDYEAHLAGEQPAGIYLMHEDSTVLCSAADIDNHKDGNPAWVQQTDAVCDVLRDHAVPYVREISQSGTGTHVWTIYDEHVPAPLARRFWRMVSRESGVTLPEIYPRQDRLDPGQLGSLILLPLHNQSRFVDDRWEEIHTEDAIRTVTQSAETLRNLLGEEAATASEGRYSIPASVQRQLTVGSLAKTRWDSDTAGMADTSRSAIVMAIARALIEAGVILDDIEEALYYWCVENDYDKHTKTATYGMPWIKHTVDKALKFHYAGGCSVGPPTTLAEWSPATMEEAALAAHERKSQGAETIYATGISTVDNSIEGVRPGEMAVVAARPSQGKTAFGLEWANHASQEVPVLIISEEMSKIELGKRMSLRMRTDSIEDIRQHFADRKRIFIEENLVTIEKCEEMIEQHVRHHGVKMVVVDYLQLLTTNTRSSEYEEVTVISRKFKQLARTLDIAVVCLCQLNRQVEMRDGKVPQMSDIRGSGQVEQDSDLVLMLQWPNRDVEYYRVWAIKRRNGAIKEQMITTYFDAGRQVYNDHPTKT